MAQSPRLPYTSLDYEMPVQSDIRSRSQGMTAQRSETFEAETISHARTRSFGSRRTPTTNTAIRDSEALITASVFGLEPQIIRDHPGTRAYCLFIEEEIKHSWCGNDAIAAVFETMGYATPMDLTRALKIFAQIADVLRTNDRRGISLSELFELVLEQHAYVDNSTDRDFDEIPQNMRQMGQHLVFSVIGWTSMLFQPAHGYSSSTYSLLADTRWTSINPSQPASADISDRPITKFLRNFGDLMPVIGGKLGANPYWSENVASPDAALFQPTGMMLSDGQIQTSILNYYSLKKMAHINIEWTNSLGAHLNFHAASRTLFMFKYPTFCMLNCLEPRGKIESGQNCFDRVLREYCDYQDINRTQNIVEAYKREVILSYRLIFGQRQNSRDLYKKPSTGHTGISSASSKQQQQQPTTTYSENLLDTLCKSSRSSLSTLPGEIWPESCRDINGNLLEQDTYSTSLDFQYLGPRLLRVQEFCRRQNPSRIRDLWRDRRNPLQWYTFWAVIIVGGLSIILQLVQIGLATAQLVYTPQR